MLKSNVGIEEKVAELVLKCSEKTFADLILNLCRQFVVEIKFFNDKVVIVHKSVLNEFFNAVVKSIGDFLFFVAGFKAQKPEIELFHPCVDQRLEALVT